MQLETRINKYKTKRYYLIEQLKIAGKWKKIRVFLGKVPLGSRQLSKTKLEKLIDKNKSKLIERVNKMKKSPKYYIKV